MGNRAVIFFKDNQSARSIGPGVYLHWNGGPESVLAFLETMRRRGWTRMDYAAARFAGVVSEFFDHKGDCSGLSMGLVSYSGDVSAHDPGDNGVYIVEREGEGFRVRQHVSEYVNGDMRPLARNRDVTELGEKAREQYIGMVQELEELRAWRKARVIADQVIDKRKELGL